MSNLQIAPEIAASEEARTRRAMLHMLEDLQRERDSIKRLNRVYAVLSQINTLIVRVQNRDALFREATRIAVEHGGFRMAWIGMVDREAGIVRPVATAGEVGDFFADAPMAVLESNPGGHGLTGRAVRAKKPMISNDVRNDPQRLMRAELEARGINSLAVIPLLVDGEATGVLALYATDVGFFDEAEMKLLLELADDVAFALDHLHKAERLNYLAYYDALTGLANRSFLEERVAEKIRVVKRDGGRFALLKIDLDRFRLVNESLGRQSGDAVLRQVAQRLAAIAPDSRAVARLGDRFALLVPEVGKAEDLGHLIVEISAACFAEPFKVEATELRVSAKVGVVLCPDDGGEVDALFNNAEAALKRAKQTGEAYLFYEQKMTERVAEKLSLESELRRAVEREEFVLHYQPKVDLETRAVVGVEALIRWQRPGKGLVPPVQFIPLLEETGLILPVGIWALRRAARDHRAWSESGLKAPRVAVNVSAIQLRQRDFVAMLEQAVREGVAPTAIDLEITESLVMQDIKSNIEKLKAARGLGVQIAIDDFGTGYSSLAYLAQLPVNALKIDRSFIVKMQEDPNSMTLVSTMISLARSLRLKVVAEGVETEDQARFLRLLRCDEMQGYLFSKPVPAEQLVKLLPSRA